MSLFLSLWLSIQGSTLFTFPAYSVDRFSEPRNSSRCAYEPGVSSCISINSAWGGKCSVSPCAFTDLWLGGLLPLLFYGID